MLIVVHHHSRHKTRHPETHGTKHPLHSEAGVDVVGLDYIHDERIDHCSQRDDKHVRQICESYNKYEDFLKENPVNLGLLFFDCNVCYTAILQYITPVCFLDEAIIGQTRHSALATI